MGKVGHCLGCGLRMRRCVSRAGSGESRSNRLQNPSLDCGRNVSRNLCLNPESFFIFKPKGEPNREPENEKSDSKVDMRRVWIMTSSQRGAELSASWHCQPDCAEEVEWGGMMWEILSLLTWQSVICRRRSGACPSSPAANECQHDKAYARSHAEPHGRTGVKTGEGGEEGP